MFAGLLLPLALAAEVAPAPRPLPDWSCRAQHDGTKLPPGAVRAFGDPRFRPFSDLTTFSPDGKLVAGATGLSGGEIAVWDFATGRLVCRFARGAHRRLLALRFTPDGSAVFVVGHSDPFGEDPAKQVTDARRFDARTGKQLGRPVVLPHPPDYGGVVYAAAPAACDAVYTVGERGTLTAFDPATGRTAWRYFLGRAVGVESVAVSADGKRVAAVVHDHKEHRVALLDPATARELGRIVLPELYAPPVFSPDGDTLAVPSTDRGLAVTVWDVPTLGRKATLPLREELDRLAFSPDGKLLAVGRRGKGVSAYEAATGKPAYAAELPRYADDVIAFSPDGRALAVPLGVGLHLLDANTGKSLPRSADPRSLWRDGSLRFSPDGETLWGTSADPDTLTGWDVRTGRERVRYDRDDEDCPPLPWIGTRFSPDGRFWVSNPCQPRLLITDAATGRKVSDAPWKPQQNDSHHWELSADGRFLFGTRAGRVDRYDTATGERLAPLAELTDFPRARPAAGGNLAARPLAWASPCGRFVAVVPSRWDGPEIPVRVCDPATGKKLGEWTTDRTPDRVHWSSDGSRLAALASPGTDNGAGVELSVDWAVTVWEVPSGRVVSRAAIREDVWVTAFSPDLRTVVVEHQVGSGDAVVLYEAATGRRRHAFDARESWRGVAAFGPDGRFLATAHPMTPVLLWDVRGTSPRPSTPPDVAGWERAWAALAGKDAEAAFAAVRLFAAFPEQAVPFLAQKLPVPVKPDAARVARLAAALGAEEFADREASARELESLGRFAERELREAVKSAASPEARDRAGRLLARFAVVAGEDLRVVRAVEAVEWMGTADAAGLLRRWAAGPDGARLTAEASTALARVR